MSGVQLNLTGGVATVTLDNVDKYNALDIPMLEALERHIGEIERNPNARVLVITGAGKKATI